MCYQLIPMAAERVGGVLNARDAKGRALQDEARQRGFTQEANDRVAQTIGQISASNPDAARKSASDDLLAALRSAGLLDGGTNFGTPGAVSSRYATDTAAARGATQAENLGAVDRLSRIDAPAYQRTNEGRIFANTASDLARIGSRSQGESYLAKLRLAGIGGAGG
jgi:hypothetical protein